MDGYGVSPDAYGSTTRGATPGSYLRYLYQSEAGLPVVAPKGVQYGLSGVGGDRYGITGKLHWEIGSNALRSAERRVGKECVSPCRSWWVRYHSKTQNMMNITI